MEKTWTEVEWDWEEWQPPQLPFDWWEFVATEPSEAATIASP